MNVSAEDKGTGKKEKITITNDKGRLTEEEIERMVKEAEEFAEQDKKVKERVTSRGDLETYCYNIKNQLSDQLKDLVSEDDKEKMEEAVNEALEWLEENEDAETEDFKEKLKDVQDICQPIIAEIYQKHGGAAGGGGDADGEYPDEDEDDIKIEL